MAFLAVITGASSGIGEATAGRLARAAYRKHSRKVAILVLGDHVR